MFLKENIVSPPYPQVSTYTDSTIQQTANIRKKNPESFEEQNSNLPQAGNYSHNMYIVFITIYRELHYIALGILDNPEII